MASMLFILFLAQDLQFDSYVFVSFSLCWQFDNYVSLFWYTTSKILYDKEININHFENGNSVIKLTSALFQEYKRLGWFIISKYRYLHKL